MVLINALPTKFNKRFEVITMKQMNLKVKGMHCPSCEALVKESLEDAGVKSAQVSHKTGNVKASFDESRISEKKIKQIIADEGYKVE